MLKAYLAWGDRMQSSGFVDKDELRNIDKARAIGTGKS